MEKQHHWAHFCLTLSTAFRNVSILVAAEGPADAPSMLEGPAVAPLALFATL